MRALANWHFGKGRGRDYCEGCVASGAACATTERKDCPYHKFAGRDDAEHLAWRVFDAEAWRMRVGGMGVVLGIESGPAVRKLVRAGLDEGLAEELIGACEQGMVAALNEKDGGDDDEGNRDTPVRQGQGTG